MKNKKLITILVIFIAILSGIASSFGIFSTGGPGKYEYQSIRGETVEIYGVGLYKDMSAQVAPQGIAQDYVTLFIAIPLLLISLFLSLRGSLRWRFVLNGTLGYFLVSYLFYLVMAMYNPMFLAYTALLGLTFFAFLNTIFSFDIKTLSNEFSPKTPTKFIGWFLVIGTSLIALMWLSIVVPPLIDGSIAPKSVEHFTTLIVQGMDLGLLLPLAMVSAIMLLKKKPLGYLSAAIYYVFLSFLMTALSAKIIAMGLLGYGIIPAIFIIPVFNICAITFTVILLKNIKK
ncbi:MAG: hypothetical protein WCR42_05820 [bacterium]